ncbi:MAG: hypothetical protein QM726_19575 [Chitinophagaceae bacterium]
MKKLVKPVAIAVALIAASFSQNAHASTLPYSKYANINSPFADEKKFTIELNREGDEEVIYAQIENPERKNLFVTLSAPDGSTIDNFCTGRKSVKLNKRYNFIGADAGVYTLTISDGSHKIKKEIKLERLFSAPVSKLEVH